MTPVIHARQGALASLAGRARAALVFVVAIVATAGPLAACDICGVYTASELQETRAGWELGVAEQFTDFGRLQQDGEEVDNPFDENLDSWITQFILAYRFHPRIGVQLNIPLISRHYRRMIDDGVETGSSTGLGDLSLIANGTLYSRTTTDTVVRFSAFAGVKVPSGDSSFLGEDGHEGEDDHDGHGAAEAAGESSPDVAKARSSDAHGSSSVHGHDLALGTGSTDFLVGAKILATWKRLQASAGLQYSVRTEGSFEYQYANEFSVHAGPGVFLLKDDERTLALQALVLCDTKGKDTQGGEKVNDSGYTGVYAGPGLDFTWSSTISANVVADIPIVRNNSGLQIVPDYRLRGGFMWRF